jgi:dynein heavy chain
LQIPPPHPTPHPTKPPPAPHTATKHPPSKVAAGKRSQAELEDTILALLSSASGPLLDNVALIDALDASKATWEAVNASLAVAEATARELEAAAAGYRPCSVRAAALYFVLNDLAAVDPMYQFSLDAYASLFALSLRASPKSEALPDRIKALNDHHTYAVYKYAARALFEKHKLLLALHMAARVLALAGQVNAEEWGFFLRGGQVGKCYLSCGARGCIPFSGHARAAGCICH